MLASFTRFFTRSVPSVLAVAVATVSITAAEVVDPGLEEYKPVSGVSGNLNSAGSDTLSNLMTFWAEGFSALYPNVNIQMETKGSSSAPPALIEGTSQLGPMSREMKSSEIDLFESKYGYKPTRIAVCIDALAIFVHKDNPIKGLSLAQVDAIFSVTRKRDNGDIKTWGDLGLTGEWAAKPLSLYGRNSASGTYGFFKDNALKGGDFKSSVKEQPGSSAVVQGVSSDLSGVGYSGIGYRTSGVRALSLSEKGATFAEPSHENCLNGEYPLARFLYVYINKKPGTKADPMVEQFIRFVLSKQGQAIVLKDGYYPLTAEVAKETLDVLAK